MAAHVYMNTHDRKEIKQAIVSYGVDSFFISEMVKMWDSSNQAVSQD